MMQGFYLYFQRVLQCSPLSALLARCAYFLFLCRYWIKRAGTKAHVISLSHEEAEALVAAASPDPQGSAEPHPATPDKAIDLSVIIPIYNYADLIRANIESILNQKTKYRFELILVDDGSTDGADMIVRSYEADPRVKTVFQKNKGIGGARNTGLDHAVGRYIMFVDCDDLADDNLVEILMDKAVQENHDIVMCGHNLVKERNGEIYSVLPNIYPPYNLLGYAGNAKILNYPGLPWGKVYKRELFDHVRFFEGYWYEDTIIHSLIFTQCRGFAYIPEAAYEYRWYENNFSHTQGKKSNPRCVEYYWLMKRILCTYDSLGGQKDERYHTMLVMHLGYYFYHKVFGLDDEFVEALFSLACDLYDEYGKQKYRLPYMLRVTEKSLEQRDFNLWKLASQYI